MTTNQDREKFEAWALPMLGDNPTWRESADCELARQAWQAALQSQQAAAEPVKGSMTDKEIADHVRAQGFNPEGGYELDDMVRLIKKLLSERPGDFFATPYNRDAVVVNLMRLANTNKHLARDIADAAFGTPPEAA